MNELKQTILIAKMTMVNKRRFLMSMTRNNLGIILLTIVRTIFRFVVTIIFFHLATSRFDRVYIPFFVIMLLLIMTIQVSSPLLFSTSDYFKTIDYQYWAAQSISPSRLLSTIIDARILETTIDSLGFTLGVVFVLAPTFKLTTIFLIVFVNLLVMMGTYYRFFHKFLPLGTRAILAYAFSACCFSIIAYFFFDFLYKLISYTKMSVYSYGVGSTFVAKTNDDINSIIATISHSISRHIDEFNHISPILYLTIILVASVGVYIFRRILITTQTLRTDADIVIRSNYVRNYEKTVLNFTNFSTFYKSLERRYKPDCGHSRLQIFIPFEFWIFVSVNFITAHYVYNSWALATIAFLEIFLMSTALTRSITGHYKDIFEFGFELKSLRLMKILSPSLMDSLFKAKNKHLFLQVATLGTVYSAALLIQISLLKGQVYLWSLLILLSIPLALVASIWTLRPTYDAFRTVTKMNSSLMLDFHKIEMRDISVVSVFSKITQTPSRLIIFFTLLATILGASFSLIHGDIWKTVFIVISFALTFSLTLGCVGTFIECFNLNTNLRSIICSRVAFTIVIVLALIVSFITGTIHGIGLPQTMNPVHLDFMELLKHNYTVLLITIVLGLTTLGVGGLVLPCYTMFNLGLITPGIVANYGWSPLITGIAPHALFEISSFIIGILVSFEVHRLLLRLQLGLPFNMKKIISTDIALIAMSFILMMLAAFIESGVSYV